MTDTPAIDPTLEIEYVARESLRPHPDNYRGHPEDQVAHIKASIEKHGLYRPLVVSSDDVVLAGHGLLIAETELGIDTVPVVRVPYEHTDPRALQLLVGDNEIANLVDDSDAKLIDLLLQVQAESDEADMLLGTGYSEQQLAALQALTAPPKSKGAWDPNDEWDKAGMDPYNSGETNDVRLTIRFATPEARQAYLDGHGNLSELFRKSEKVWLVTHREPGDEPADEASAGSEDA